MKKLFVTISLAFLVSYSDFAMGMPYVLVTARLANNIVKKTSPLVHLFNIRNQIKNESYVPHKKQTIDAKITRIETEIKKMQASWKNFDKTIKKKKTVLDELLECKKREEYYYTFK